MLRRSSSTVWQPTNGSLPVFRRAKRLIEIKKQQSWIERVHETRDYLTVAPITACTFNRTRSRSRTFSSASGVGRKRFFLVHYNSLAGVALLPVEGTYLLLRPQLVLAENTYETAH